ncbi:16S rRNA (cytidine1402-2'-O)-methyltransferase [Litoreibacter ascidiaceicola]|uniref:Ribosomal RNA small subunit methyltransferase I n=1 Tax=Litoreibacter ascidiaceicola TaxID=1486859 RepID=A0A1M4ZAH3_9RHOB|nr:16S rRNA (cytidine(1402)-2'-O)-methyltransferase [Litoreibacter ascidiaceicola]SHF15069.1 16S rRNA (cytidine1402-2'-O)-methyltransferase [Litoreibacter ascidiaceicola]
MTAANRVNLASGLYFIATPIGTARDITLRALDILASADVLAAEDTRTLRRLMDIHGIALEGRPMVAYHDHNGASARPKLLRALADGKSVAYASEAGTPLVADPGYQLGRAVTAEGYLVTAAPGPSAVLAALSVSGLATDAFFFAGFAPTSKGQRQSFLRSLAEVPGTLVFYESPKRVHKMLADLVEVYGETRDAVVARELTKKFEEVRRGTLAALVDELDGVTLKGEVVVLVARGEVSSFDEKDTDILLKEAMAAGSLKDAVAQVVTTTGQPRRQVYQAALRLEKEGK